LEAKKFSNKIFFVHSFLIHLTRIQILDGSLEGTVKLIGCIPRCF